MKKIYRGIHYSKCGAGMAAVGKIKLRCRGKINNRERKKQKSASERGKMPYSGIWKKSRRRSGHWPGLQPAPPAASVYAGITKWSSKIGRGDGGNALYIPLKIYHFCRIKRINFRHLGYFPCPLVSSSTRNRGAVSPTLPKKIDIPHSIRRERKN